MSLQGSLTNETQRGQHLFEGMGDHVREKPLSRKAVGARGRQVGARAFVHHERYAQLLYGLVERVVVRVIEHPALHRIRSDEDRFELEVAYDPPSLIDRGSHVL